MFIRLGFPSGSHFNPQQPLSRSESFASFQWFPTIQNCVHSRDCLTLQLNSGNFSLNHALGLFRALWWLSFTLVTCWVWWGILRWQGICCSNSLPSPLSIFLILFWKIVIGLPFFPLFYLKYSSLFVDFWPTRTCQFQAPFGLHSWRI